MKLKNIVKRYLKLNSIPTTLNFDCLEQRHVKHVGNLTRWNKKFLLFYNIYTCSSI